LVWEKMLMEFRFSIITGYSFHQHWLCGDGTKQENKSGSSKFDWSDLGSFESVYDYLVSIGHPVDENGNMVIGTDNYTAL
jgi:hypothetical protein